MSMFQNLPKDKCVFTTAKFEGRSYCLVSLGKNINKLEAPDLVGNDLLFDANALHEMPISCGLKKVLELGERPDISNIPPILNEKWRILPMSKEDVIITISKYNGKVIIREAYKFPNDFCPIKPAYLEQHHPILWKFLSDPQIKTIYFSIILIWRECTFIREQNSLVRQLKFLGLVDNNTGQLKTKEACDIWVEQFDVPKTVSIQSHSRDLLTQSTAQYKNIKLAINDSAILSISDPWYCELMSNTAKLDNIDKLTSLWVTYKDRDFAKFSDKINFFSTSNKSLFNLYGAYKSLSYLSTKLYEKINEIPEESDKIKFVGKRLPYYLQPMGWAIIKNENIPMSGLKSLYSHLIKIHSGAMFNPKYC